jgi:hypothetical protein
VTPPQRIISLYPPESAQAAADRVKLLRGENGLAIALVIADFNPQISEIRRREWFDSGEFRLQLIGQLGLVEEDFRLKDLNLTASLAAISDLDA